MGREATDAVRVAKRAFKIALKEDAPRRDPCSVELSTYIHKMSIDDADVLLPLKPDVLLILTVLARGERHGYAIMREAEALSGGTVRLQPGALYRRLAWMQDAGLLAELDERPAEVEGHDERRRYYGVTPFGARVAAAEAERMTNALTAMREAGLVGGSGPDG